MATEPKTVTLVAPDGSGEVTVSHPADITNLVYGAGYRVKGKQTPDEAAALLAEKGPVAEQIAAAQTLEIKTNK